MAALTSDSTLITGIFYITIVEQLRNMCDRFKNPAAACSRQESRVEKSRHMGMNRARAGEKGYQVVQESFRNSNLLRASAQSGRSGFREIPREKIDASFSIHDRYFIPAGLTISTSHFDNFINNKKIFFHL